MAASPDIRRRRYERRPVEHLALTPLRLALLRTVAEYGIASLPQLARLVCPSPKSARRHVRELFDAGYVDVVPASRAALVAANGDNDTTLLFGSAPNIFVPTRSGLNELRCRGLIGEVPPPPRYGPRNSLFLAHELAIRDVRVWLELVARHGSGCTIESWRDGSAAVLPLGRERPPTQVRPDARFVLKLASRVLVGLVEVDRGTERGTRRWDEKLTAYAHLYATDALKAATGYVNARVLVVAPNVQRRDHLADLIAKRAVPNVAERFWLVAAAALDDLDLTCPLWRRPGLDELLPLVPSDFLTSLGETR